MYDSLLREDVATFYRLQSEITEEDKRRPWAVIASSSLQDQFESYADAFRYAASKLESGKFLIRNLVAEDPAVPMVFADPK